MIIDNNPVMMCQEEIISLATELAEAVDNRWFNDEDIFISGRVKIAKPDIRTLLNY